jgi:iron-sulfur cluster assembly accessory protein
MISFTENAEDHLKKTIVEGEIVRVAVLGGGCSGMSYTINVEDTPSDEEDLEIVIGHVKIYIDPHSAVILNHTIVDYVINLKTSGFVFMNPDANTTCGCGMSFS